MKQHRPGLPPNHRSRQRNVRDYPTKDLARIEASTGKVQIEQEEVTDAKERGDHHRPVGKRPNREKVLDLRPAKGNFPPAPAVSRHETKTKSRSDSKNGSSACTNKMGEVVCLVM